MSTTPDDHRPARGPDAGAGSTPGQAAAWPYEEATPAPGTSGHGMQPSPRPVITGEADRDGPSAQAADGPGHDDPALRTMPDLRDEAQVGTAPHPRAGGWDQDQHDRDQHDRDGRDQHDQNDRDRSSSPVDGAVETLAQPDNRAKLLLAIAVMSAITLLLALVIAIDQLRDDGADPVLVDGVPCLVEEGEDDRAVLYCQR